jgi:hypothetical protein
VDVAEDTRLNETSMTADTHCKICFSDEFTTENPLITPCQCVGSVKNVHLDCLRSWLATKTVSRERGHAKTYHLKGLNCELCKTKLPKMVQFSPEGSAKPLFQVNYPDRNYIVLENVNEGKSASIVHVIELGGKKVASIGRARSSDIRVNDISVSRNHA